MKDELFNTPTPVAPFSFNQEVVNVFDDMISRSVPHYREIQDMLIHLCKAFAISQTHIYDLGCSLGRTFKTISPHLPSSLHYIGVDNSEAMLSKARQTFDAEWVCHDLNEPFALDNASIVMMVLTLQFIRPQNRLRLLRSIRSGLREGGALLLVEKVRGETPESHDLFNQLYHGYKKDHGYSDLEIAQKRDSLETILIPYSLQENLDLLVSAGLGRHELFFKWFNFVGIIARP